MTRKKRIAAAVTSCVLLGAMAVGGTLAYLTDSEKAENKFTFGSVQIDLEEPSFVKADADNDNAKADVDNGVATYDKALVPCAVIKKDPLVENTGSEDAVVFIKLEVPKAAIQLVSDTGANIKPDGTAGADTTSKEIFAWYTGTTKGGLGSGWTTVSTTTETDSNVYVYGYNTKLAANGKTNKLFEKIQLLNMDDASYSIVAGSGYTATKSIKVEAYAVQASNLSKNGTAINTAGTMDAATLQSIYEIYAAQNKAVRVAEDGNKTLAG